MSKEVEFFKMLNTLARVCDFELDKEIIALYDQKLSTYGYDNVCLALKEIFYSRGSRDQFPSIAEIVKNINSEVSSRTQSDHVANIILTTFRNWKLRHCEREDFEKWFVEYNGEIAWTVVQKMGGYRALFDEWNYCSNLSTLRAQIRDMATSVIELAKRGQLNVPPALPKASSDPRVNELVGNTLKQIGGKK